MHSSESYSVKTIFHFFLIEEVILSKALRDVLQFCSPFITESYMQKKEFISVATLVLMYILNSLQSDNDLAYNL